MKKPQGCVAFRVLSLAVWLGISLALPFPAQGGVANPEPFQLRQPDGSAFWARAWGDEWSNGIETLEGFTILFDAQSRRWVYAERTNKGQLAPSAFVAHQPAPAHLPRRLRPLGQTSLPSGAPKLGPGFQPAPPTAGTQRLLAIVVDFTPSSSLGTTEAQWEQYFFTGGGGPVVPTSVKNYWDTVSYGAISLQPAAESYGTMNNGIVFVTLNYPHPNPPSTGDSNRQITRDALIAANSSVDFASFDSNADGYLNTNELHIYIVVRGYEGSFGTGCLGGRVWAHRWSLGFGAVSAPTLDGVVVAHYIGALSPGAYMGGYMLQGEWHCRSGHTPGHIATIGVACHELGHDMGTGVPDLYDTDTAVGTASSGIGAWGLQGGGSWNGGGISGHEGTHPAFPDPWSRWFFGFLTPTLIMGSQAVSFPQIETAAGSNRGVFQLLPNPGGVDWPGIGLGGVGAGEYFLVENRQQVGYDAGLPGHGLLIWHIDESASSNADEGASPPGNKRIVVLEQADGRYDLECYANPPNASLCNSGDASDPWKSGTATSFTDTSTPNSRLYDGASSEVSATNISVSAATMSATLAAPLAATLPATSITTSSAALNGSVNPNGLASNAWFEWGDSPTLASFTATTQLPVGSGATMVSISQGISGLTAGTAYFYRAVMSNSSGTFPAAIRRFFTVPANDNFAGATVVPGLPYSNTVNTAATTTEGTDPTSSTFPDCGNFSRAKSVWYRFTPLSNVTLTAYTYNSSYDTILSVHIGSPGSFTEVACNDDASIGAQSQVTFSATAGTTYSFLITSYDGAGGTLIFNLQNAGLLPDNFASATVISALPYTHSVNTTSATTEATDPTPSCPAGAADSGRAKSVWYRFTPACNTVITANTFGSNYDTILSAYTGSPALSFSQVACNDDARIGVQLQSQVTFSATAGTTYSFMVTAWDGSGGTLVFNLQSAPCADTSAASSITRSSATLNAVVNPNGLDTIVSFKWGADPTLSTFNSTTSQPLGAGFAPVPFSAPTSGLTPATTYYFRAVASNGSGTTQGSILSFRTRTVTQIFVTENFRSLTISSANSASSARTTLDLPPKPKHNPQFALVKGRQQMGIAQKDLHAVELSNFYVAIPPLDYPAGKRVMVSGRSAARRVTVVIKATRN